MMRLVSLAAGVMVLLSCGCTHDGEFSIRKSLGFAPTEDASRNVVKLPRPVAVSPESIAKQERVELIGRQIIARNTFCGIDPLFTMIHDKENILFHANTAHLYISEGLVDKCSSDAELAAVLCAGLGKMQSEQRSAKAVGRDVDPIPDVGFGGNNVFPGGTALDVGRQAELALHEKKYPRQVVGAVEAARDLLKGAGYSPAELDRVEPLLQKTKQSNQIRTQLAGPASVPTWEK